LAVSLFLLTFFIFLLLLLFLIVEIFFSSLIFPYPPKHSFFPFNKYMVLIYTAIYYIYLTFFSTSHCSQFHTPNPHNTQFPILIFQQVLSSQIIPLETRICSHKTLLKRQGFQLFLTYSNTWFIAELLPVPLQ
jgi:hypothetical protein